MRLGKKIVIYAVLLATAALPAAVKALSAADQQEIQRFTLTEDFLHRYEAVLSAKQSGKNDGSEETSLAKASAIMSSLDAMTAEITKSPKNVVLLQLHGLTAREAVVGGLVLMRASMADSMLADPKMAKYVDTAKTPSAANMAFYRAHKEEIAQLMKKSGSGDNSDNK